MTLESPLDCKEIQPVHPQENQSSIFTERTDAEAETPILWPSDAKNWLTGKDPDAGKDRKQEKETTEDEMVGWHHWLNGHGFEQTLGVGDGQGGLACCSSWGHKELDMTERLNWIIRKKLDIFRIPKRQLYSTLQTNKIWGNIPDFFKFLKKKTWPYFMAWGILVPWPRIKSIPPAVEAQSLNHWTAREALEYSRLKQINSHTTEMKQMKS